MIRPVLAQLHPKDLSLLRLLLKHGQPFLGLETPLLPSLLLSSAIGLSGKEEKWEKGKQKGLCSILIACHGPFPKGVSSLQKINTPEKGFYQRKGAIGKQCSSLTFMGGKAREIPDASKQVTRTSQSQGLPLQLPRIWIKEPPGRMP